MLKTKKRLIKIIGIIVGVLLIMIVAASYFIGNYFYDLALNPKTDKSVVFDSPQNEVPRNEDDERQRRADKWFEEVDVDEVKMNSRDGLKLHAYQIMNEKSSNKWVIICHGYNGEALQMKKSAQQFYNMGYNVILPDARGHGLSEGDYIGMGWDERLDLVDRINSIADKNKEAQIVLYGVSMGGATVMMTSGENLPDNVKAIVEDCGYTSVRDEFEYQLKVLFGLPAFPVLDFASIVANIRAGYSINKASALEQVKKSTTPILFIHGDDDTFVPFSMVHEVYDAASCEKELYIVPGAKHGEASSVAKDEYWNKVETFMNQYID